MKRHKALDRFLMHSSLNERFPKRFSRAERKLGKEIRRKLIYYISSFAGKQIDIESDFVKVIDKHFWDILA